jgi:hypothetical protein
MVRRRFSLRALFVIMTLAAMILALLPSASRPLDQTHFNRLKTGMNKAEVETLLHGSARNEISRAMIWIPQNGGGRISHLIESESPAADFFPDAHQARGYQRLWITKTGLIAVYFDPDDKLQREYFSTVHPMGPPTITDWLASRPNSIRQSLGL